MGRGTRAGGRRKLLLLAAFAISPVVASYAAYYWFAPAKRVNYGELLETRPVPEIAGTLADGSRFSLTDLRGRWLLLVVTSGECDEACLRALSATRQARTIQGREQDRVLRVWLRTANGSPPAREVLALHPGLVAAHADRDELARLPIDAGDSGILLIDPLGNLVLRYGADADIRRLANDLGRLLSASQVG
ncbi:MAG TPA: hypothetical protein VEN29_19665 [Casimicrobiaceae bacterium]|nr:hypothetical protein [Casimicrobiaceae bacterium]